MRFLYGIKQCSKCAKNRTCKLKNDPSNLMKEPVIFEVVNRSTKRHAMPPIKIATFCKDFSAELPELPLGSFGFSPQNHMFPEEEANQK